MSEQDTQVTESTTTDTQEQELEVKPEETTDEETVETLKAQLAEKDAQLQKEAEARRQLTARAKAAEAAKPKVEPQKNINNPIDDAMIEKKILKSQGMSDELLGELETLAKVRGKSLLDTQTDPIFIALKETKEAEAKAVKAKLGASRGSGTVKASKDFNTPGLSEAEHKEMWRASQGK
jgi:hypothetical protein